MALRSAMASRGLGGTLLALAAICAFVGVAGAVPPVPCNSSAGACWTPPLNARWQYQLEARGRRYVSTGGINVDLCVKPFTKGACVSPEVDGIEFDVVDAYAQGEETTGWNISAATQLEYDQKLANLAHEHGLTVALKNNLGQLAELRPYFDYAINEQCFQYEECDNNPAPGYDAWVAAGKTVFTVEYRRSLGRFCPEANAANYNSIKKSGNFSLYDKAYKPCR